MKVNICGQLFGSSGYVNHTKGLANALNKLMDVRISTPMIQNWERFVNDAELEMLKRGDSYDRVNIIIDLPFNWNQYAYKEKNVGFLVWEGDKIPISWVDNIKDNRINQVWVPSTHVYEAIKNRIGEGLDWQIIRNKIKIVPHGVNLDLFKPEVKEHMFTFLVNKGFRGELDRGGMQHAIRAFLEEFDQEEIRLILKLNPAYAISPEQLVGLLNSYAQKTGKNEKSKSKIEFTYDNMSIESLKDLYNNSDVLLNPTEGEAFSLPSIESMGCGKPVIATDFGGQTDFISNSNGWLIPYDLHEVKHEVMYEGVKWGKIKIDILKKAMREAYENRELVKNKGQKAIETAKNWSWDNSALKAQQALNEMFI